MPALTDVTAQREIDQQISEHEAAILALKTRRNTHTAISKLPTELIADIFLLRRQQFVQHLSESYPRGRNWLNVSCVCRQWRAVVLDTPQLWCFVDLSWRAKNASKILKRSKSLPLRVRCLKHSYDSARFGLVAKAVMSHRLQELDLRAKKAESLTEFLKLNPSGSAPVLEVLKLKSSCSSEITLPQDALWNDMPALRVLELDDIFLASPLPVLPCLTRLVHNQVPSTSWLIDSLRRTPLIQEIDISALDLPSDGVASEIPVSLPKLTYLRIRTAHLGTSKVFDHIIYPDSAVVEFESLDVLTPQPFLDFSSLQRLCSKYSARDGATSAHEVQIDVGGHDFMVQLKSSDADSSPHLTITLPQPPLNDVVNYVDLCLALPLTTIQTLVLTGSDEVPIARWVRLFPHCQQVTILRLTHCGYDTVRGLLATDDKQKPPLERLETLIMCDCVFNLSYDEPDTRMVNTVTGVLRKRKKLGLAIQELRIENCEITGDVVADLERRVEVDWDGIEIEEESEDDSDQESEEDSDSVDDTM